MNVKQTIEQLRQSAEAVEFKAKKAAWLEAHPDVPVAKAIPVLNLIMKKEFAESVLKGEKVVEFRAYSQHYCDRLFDNRVQDYAKAHANDNDEEIAEAIEEGYIDCLRDVRKIHFHNYSNTWHLDVECLLNDEVAASREDAEFLASTFGCHELDEMVAELDAKKEKRRPMFFYFVLGDVIDTNLR